MKQDFQYIQLLSKYICNIYFYLRNHKIRLNKRKVMRWTADVARMVEMRNAYCILFRG